MRDAIRRVEGFDLGITDIDMSKQREIEAK